MKPIISLTALLVAVAFVSASATIINIPDDYPTIQQGIDASTDGDTVLAQPGTYVENINFNGHNIVLGSLFLTTGDTTYITETVIDGDSSGTVVTFDAGEDSTSAITGFTIEKGYLECGNGGGVSCENSSPQITYNTITRNSVGDSYLRIEGYGAGIYCNDNSNPAISHNTISNNLAAGYHQYGAEGLGGGIYCGNNSNLAIDNNIIIENRAIGFGGGIYCLNSDPVITANTISDNRAGGGIYCVNSNPAINHNNVCGNIFGGITCDSSNPIIMDNLLSQNVGNNGGAIHCLSGSNPSIINNTLWGNLAERGGAIYCRSNSSPIIINTILWANTAQDGAQVYVQSGSPVVNYCNVQGGWDGEGNMNTNPLLIDPYGEIYNVCSESPCIDAGDPDRLDPDGSRSDIGLFFPEHPGCEFGNIWYVSTEGNDTTGDGTPGNPFETIQHAIDISFHRDTVIVQNGTFSENVDFLGKNIILASSYIFTQDPFDVENTIIDGDSSFTVVYLVGCDSGSAITGLTISNGYGFSGGGIFCSCSNPRIDNNIFFANFATQGAGINLLNSKPIIEDNLFAQNRAIWYGGGIYCWNNSDAIITNNDFGENYALFNGAGIFCGNHSNPAIIKNSLTANIVNGYSPYHGGGGIYCANSSPIIANNVVSENEAGDNGGGIYLYDNSNPLIINNAIVENLADSSGGGVYNRDSYPVMINTISRANAAADGDQIYIASGWPDIIFSDIQGGWEGEGNIDVDPLFRDPENGDFHLMSTACGDPYDSPCIDAGHPDILDSLLDCSWGLGQIRSDMGAYGGGDSLTVGIDEYDIPIPQIFSLSQNYPNPFNSATVIRYALPEPAHVKIEIFDILGRKVETLIDENQQAGYHQIIWNAAEKSSGIYLYKIEAGSFTETKKMLLLK
jgi:parallel beta-helix repeat protein